jgi:mevalonate kinase
MEQPECIFSCKYSAPGKAILSGEHSVVYGKYAIAFTLKLRTYVEIKVYGSTISNDLNDLLQDYNLDLHYSWTNILYGLTTPEQSKFDLIMPLFAKIAKDLLPIVPEIGLSSLVQLLEKHKVVLSIRSALPINSGIGSSASMNVALSASLLQFFNFVNKMRFQKCIDFRSNIELFNTYIDKYAYFGESLVHGNPSGLDNTVVRVGGMITYVRTDKKFDRISFQPNFKFIIIDSHTKRFTIEIIKRVKYLKDEFPQLFENIMNSMGQCTEDIISIIKSCKELNKADEDKLQELIAINHQILSTLLITHPNLESIVEVCKKYGIASKFTGAGFGGSVIGIIKNSLLESNKDLLDQVQQELQKSGFNIICNESSQLGLQEESYYIKQ